ncbi:hypothetical protein Bca4012_068253 [Brassica carinata]|uniref:Uncharacterized protein n=1 Tax=Brassica carinata TaxID=52824 RepID=A0A8X7VTF5_BRACI|nr:hypothetical protein Bca52824_020478 [Brassica carinata]
MRISKPPGICSENIQKIGWEGSIGPNQPDQSNPVLFETKEKSRGLTLRTNALCGLPAWEVQWMGLGRGLVMMMRPLWAGDVGGGCLW